MIALRDFLTRMKSEATGCVAVLRIDLRDGTVTECSGDMPATAAGALGRIMRDLAAPQHAILPGAMPQEVIVLSGNCTYVCGRLANSPHHAVAAICRSTNLGLIISLLHEVTNEVANAMEAGA